MGLKLFGYSELSADFGDWIQANCSNCDGNYAKIPDCFLKQTWSYGGNSEVRNQWNFKEHNNWCPAPYNYHYDGYVVGDIYKHTRHWPPSYNITLSAQQDVTIRQVYSKDIKDKLCQELTQFNDLSTYASENGLITYMNIIGRFMSQHFTFVSSPFSTELLIIYTPEPYASLPVVPQNTLPKNEQNPPETGTRDVVHSETVAYYINNIFQNIKQNIRKVQFRYNIDGWDSNGYHTNVTL